MNQRDLLVWIDSQFNDRGFKSAEASAKTMVRELDRQEKAVRDLARLQMAAQRENEARQAAQVMGLQKVGKATTAMGLVVAAGMGLAAKSAMDWETAWTGVTKTVNGTAEEMGVLEDQLRDLAKTLPSTHEEIAGVAEAAGQLGIRRQDVAAFTKTMIDLGVSTNLTADEAATGIAQISNVMGTLQREGTAGISKFGATLVALGNDGASTEADILDMAQRISGAGKLIGASESDVLALANAMSSMGIESELGGGVMTRTMMKVYTAVKSGGQALDDFARVAGMTGEQFATAFGADPVRAIDAFVQGLNGVEASGGNVVQTLGDLGITGSRDAQVLLQMKGSGDLLTRSLDLGNKAWQENLALVNEANKRYETAASRVAIARNQLNDAAIDIGGTVLPAVAGAADRVGFLAEAFQSLPGPAKEAVTWLGGVVAILATVGGLAMLAIPKLAAMNATLAATGPAGAKAAAGLSRFGGMLAGPLGIALTAATIGLGIWAEKQFEAEQRAKALAETLDEQTGAITQNSRQWAISTLLEDGTLEKAKAMGVNLDDLTEAALGNADAQARVNAQLEFAQGLMLGAPGDIAQVRAAITGQNEDLEAARTKWTLANEAMGATGEAADGATGPTKALGGVIGETADEADRAQKEVEELTKAVLDYGETVAEARDKNRAYEGSIDDAAESLADYKKALVDKRLKDQGFGTGEKDKKASKDDIADAKAWAQAQIDAGKALDIHSEAGRKNQAALDAIAQAAKDAAVANFENGMSVDEVSDGMMSARKQFVDMATDMGMSTKKANELADQLGLTRQNVDTLSDAVNAVPTAHATKLSVNTEAALARVAAFRLALSKIHDPTIRYTFEGRLPNGGVSTKGGSTFGDGGYTGDIPRTAPAGTVHGREFVSNADTTTQWRGLLEHMHRGGDPRAYLGMTAPTGGSSSTTSSESWDYSVNNYGPMTVVAPDSRSFGRSMQQRAYDANRSAS